MDISALQQMVQLQALSQMTSGNQENSSSSPATGDASFQSLFNQALSGQTQNSSATPNLTQSLGLTNGLNSLSQNNTSAMAAMLISSLSASLASNLLGGTSGVSNNVGTNPANMYQQYVNTYQTNAAKTDTIAPTSSNSPKTKYDAIIKKASETYGIPEKMIKAVIKQESDFNPTIKSYAGAAGLMQLMPATAAHVGVTDVYNPEQNIMGGTKYLRMMLDKFGGDYKMMLAAYNAGPGNVMKYKGIPPFNETQNYVKKVMNSYQA